MMRCSKCKEAKALDEFHRAKGRPNGRHPQCKECRSQISKEARLRSESLHAERLRLRGQGQQRCSSCDLIKDMDSFYRSSRNKSGRKGQCIDCYKSAGAEYRNRPETKEKYRERRLKRISEDPDAVRRREREQTFRYKYGIGISDYEQMLADQDGRCAICFVIPMPDKPLYVDHDHGTGEVRGLLCQQCNSGLGMFGDDPNRVRSALRYLSQPDGLIGAKTWAAAWTEKVT